MEKTPGDPSTGAMGTVSTHLVNDPHRCTCKVTQVGWVCRSSYLEVYTLRSCDR